MKKVLSYFLLFFIIIVDLSAKEITLCREDVVVYPWYIDDPENGPGLTIYQVELLAKLANVKFKIIKLPWKRCQTEVQSGRIDGLLSASYNTERSSWGAYPRIDMQNVDKELSLHTDSFYVFTNKNSKIKFENGAFYNLENKPIGVPRGYSSAYNLKQLGLKTNSSFISTEAVLNALKDGEIEIGLIQYNPALYILDKNPSLKEAIVKSAEPFSTNEQFLVFNNLFFQQHKELVKKIWSLIPETKKDKGYLELKKKLQIE